MILEISTTIWDSVYNTIFYSAIIIIVVWTIWDLTSRFRGNISIRPASEIYCTSCGASNTSDAIFCSKCGNKFDDEYSSGKKKLPKKLKIKKTAKDGQKKMAVKTKDISKTITKKKKIKIDT